MQGKTLLLFLLVLFCFLGCELVDASWGSFFTRSIQQTFGQFSFFKRSSPVCAQDTFGTLCKNKVNVLYQYSIVPTPPLTISNALEINDGNSYTCKWSLSDGTSITNCDLSIANPLKQCNGCKQLSITFSVENAGQSVFSKNVQINFILPELNPSISYAGDLKFLIGKPVSWDNLANNCKVGTVQQKVDSLKDLTSFTNYTTFSFPCNASSLVKVPYFGNPYTKFLFTYENLVFSSYYPNGYYTQEKSVVQYFPTFFANLGNTTDISVSASDRTLSFDSIVSSNIPVLKCKADLTIGNTITTIYESSCTSFLNFSYVLPIYNTNASLTITLSSQEYFFEEIETFDIELSKCSLCQNGICKLSSNIGGAHCGCPEFFFGDYCQYCKDGFVKLSGKCVCPIGYLLNSTSDCVLASSNATSCFGYSVSESDRACSYHGICNLNTHLCECSGNFDGERCTICKTGYTGVKCDIPICHGVSAIDSTVCNGKGDCVAPDTCQCNSNYYGPNCASFKCNGIEKNNPTVCSSHGYCSSADVCTCSSNFDSSSFCSKCLPSFNGTDCSTRVCSSETTCKGHGQCNDQLQCVCNGKFTGNYCEKCLDGWVGSNCDISCSAQTTCSGKGTCSATGSCICSATSYGDHCESCKPGWYGTNCDFNIDFNSFEFNDNGDAITATVQSVFKKNIDCSSLIVNSDVLGQSASCILDGDKNLLTINLGVAATIVIKGVLTVRNYIDSKTTTNAIVFGDYYQRVDPVASITSDKSIIGCGNMFLDASASSSLDRRRLIFTFSATAAPNNQALTILNNLISATTQSTVKFSVNNMTSGTYTVQVAVQSSFSGRVSYASYSFMVTDASPPNLNIKNGLLSTITIGSSFVVSPIVSFPSCYSGTASISSLKFTYTQLSGPTLQIKQKNEMLVFSSDYTKLTEEGKYVFNLNAIEQGYPGASITFEIVAVALPLKVSFSIRDMSQTLEDNIKFTVTKQDPSNPDDTSGQVALSCVNMETLQTCDGFTNGTNIDQTTLIFNQKFGAGIFLFTAIYTKGSRTSLSRVKITVTNQSKASFLRVYISSPIGVDLSSIDPSNDLILQAQSLDTLTSQRTFLWTTEFDSSTLDLKKKYFSIPKSVLVPGASFTVSVKVVDGSKIGEASISFVVNSPPTMGSLEINPSTGVALVDEFKVSCGNGWSDAQLPLTFKFLFRVKGETFWKVLKERSEMRSFSTVMANGQIEIKSIVYDAQGASTETTQTIQVTSPVDISSAVQSLNTLATASITSSSTSSALSVIQSLKPQTPEEKQKVIETGSKIALAYFTQIEKEETVTSQTITTTSSSISVISSISTCVANLPDTTVSFIITKFKSTVDGAYSKLVLPDEEVESSLSSASTIQSYVIQSVAKRSIEYFSKVDVQTIDLVKETLVELKLKNFVADMPAARTFGSDYYQYIRLLSVSSLSNLNDTVSTDSFFTLSQPFSTLSQVSSMDTVKLVMKVQQQNGTVSKLFSFKLESSNSEVTVSGDSPIAKLTIENNKGVQGSDGTTYECKILQNGELTSLSGCVIVSSTGTSFTVSVPSTGSYAIVAKKDYLIDLVDDNLKYLAFLTLLIPITALIIIIIIVVVCLLKKKRKSSKIMGV